jgi:hypothetical protein
MGRRLSPAVTGSHVTAAASLHGCSVRPAIPRPTGSAIRAHAPRHHVEHDRLPCGSQQLLGSNPGEMFSAIGQDGSMIAKIMDNF